jgi:hypothetical protein
VTAAIPPNQNLLIFFLVLNKIDKILLILAMNEITFKTYAFVKLLLIKFGLIKPYIKNAVAGNTLIQNNANTTGSYFLNKLMIVFLLLVFIEY